jgi:(S)-ureidoglycine-glyoxylate aminotransferase
MGESSRQAHVLTLLGALEEIVVQHGLPVQAGRAVQAAVDIYTGSRSTTRRSA